MTVTESRPLQMHKDRLDCPYESEIRELMSRRRLSPLAQQKLTICAIVVNEYHLSGECIPDSYWQDVLNHVNPEA